MSDRNNSGGHSGAVIADVYRLYSTLTSEYIPHLQIVITPFRYSEHQFGTRIEVVDEGLMGEEGQKILNVWSMREFVNPLHLISSNQLFDLLIVAHRQIDRYFRLGEAEAPIRRTM